jgi:CAAX protease family protein
LPFGNHLQQSVEDRVLMVKHLGLVQVSPVHMSDMSTSLKLPMTGVLLAIAITTAMDANGLMAFSALPLFPLMVLFWYFGRFSRTQMGFVWGQRKHYALATLHPILVLGTIVLIGAVAGVIDLSKTEWPVVWRNFALVSVSTFLVATITEEGFFRGWLWGSLERTGQSPRSVLIYSSIAFALWHLSAVLLDTGFKPPPAQIPVFMLNAAVMGAIWGLLRGISGSVLVASLAHGLWNGGAYVFFGFGTRTGALGIENTALYGPEVGILGLGLNVLFAAALWRWGMYPAPALRTGTAE